MSLGNIKKETIQEVNKDRIKNPEFLQRIGIGNGYCVTTTAADVDPIIIDSKKNIYACRILNTPWIDLTNKNIYLFPDALFNYKNDWYFPKIFSNVKWVCEPTLQTVLFNSIWLSQLQFQVPDFKVTPNLIVTLETLNNAFPTSLEFKTYMKTVNNLIIITPSVTLEQTVKQLDPKIKNEMASVNRKIKLIETFNLQKIAKFPKPVFTKYEKPKTTSNFFMSTENALLGCMGVHLVYLQERNFLGFGEKETFLPETYYSGLKEICSQFFPEPFTIGNSVASSVYPLGNYCFPMMSDDGITLSGYGGGFGFVGNGCIVIVGHEGKLSSTDLISLTNRIKGTLSKREKLRPYTDMVKTINIGNITSTMKQEIIDHVMEGGVLLLGGQNWYWCSVGNDLKNYIPNNTLIDLGFYLTSTITGTNIVNNPLTIRKSFNINMYLKGIMKGMFSRDFDLNSLDTNSGTVFIDSIEAYNRSAYCQQEKVILENVLAGALKRFEPKLPGTLQINLPTVKHYLMFNIARILWENKKYDPLVLSQMFEPNYITKYYDRLPGPFTYTLHKNAVSGELISTRAFLIPGTRSMATLSSAQTFDVRLVVGAQIDNVDESYPMTRPPSVSRRYVIPAGQTSVELNNFCGGIIYLLPSGTLSTTSNLKVTFTNVVEYFWFSKTVDPTTAYNTLQRKNKLPYMCEVEADRLIVTCDTAALYNNIKSGADLTKLLTQYNDTMDQYVWLRYQDYPKPERIIHDWKISAGWMHAGYPIMAHLPGESVVLKTGEPNTIVWGQYHELGHNCQRSVWEFRPETTESQCNIFSAYMLDYYGIAQTGGYYGQAAPNSKRNFLNRFVTQWEGIRTTKGANLTFTDLVGQYWLALFVVLMTEFGWTCGRKFFSYYYKDNVTDLPNISDRQQTVVKYMSKACDRDLTDYYAYWGFPILDATKTFCATCGPKWTIDLDKYTNPNSTKWNFQFQKLTYV